MRDLAYERPFFKALFNLGIHDFSSIIAEGKSRSVLCYLVIAVVVVCFNVKLIDHTTIWSISRTLNINKIENYYR